MTPLHLRRRQPERSIATHPPVAVAAAIDGVGVVDGAKDSDGVATAIPSTMQSQVVQPTTVMVVGGGSSASIAVVRALSSRGHKVVAVEHDVRSPGLRLAELGAVLPPADDPSFEKAVLSVVKTSEARAVMAVEPEEMHVISKVKDMLSGLGTSVWTPEPQVFDVCAYRPLLIRELTASGLAPDKTGLGKTHEGRSSSKRYRKFSVDVLGDRNFDLVACVSSWCVAENGGETTVAETFFDARLLDLARAVCAAVRIEGPAVLEGYVPGDGGPALTSIRPGFSPLVPLTIASGIDIVSLALAGTLGQKMPPRLLEHRKGVRMLQYLDQVFEESQ
jgi:hypothetical protein